MKVRFPYAAVAVALGCFVSCSPESESSAVAPPFEFDTYPAITGEVPVLEGAGGILDYADGCLFVRDYEGGATGVIMPDSFGFDGQILTDGETTFYVGRHAGFSGQLNARSEVSDTSCKTLHLVKAQNVFAPLPPPDNSAELDNKDFSR
ncbi:hypothetical protein [Aurantiacibacter atlanticus]|uniref:hypothetical protein n=1 Tax=Aurantiacibacter atlanticus TaxID=1648404 RepID=UPI00065F3EB6|nr:hypothetical protein [Aurantiacibacter atlanticus]